MPEGLIAAGLLDIERDCGTGMLGVGMMRQRSWRRCIKGLSKFVSADGITLRRCDKCFRHKVQTIGTSVYCELHLLMKLLELEDATGMRLIKVVMHDK